MRLTEVRLDRRRDLGEFLRLPLTLYRGDPNFVPPLALERRRFFSPANPLFDFTEARFYLLRDDRGRPIGRISAHVNRRHNDFTGERTGFFGFFECVPRLAAAARLLEAAETDLRARGMTAVRGPFNFSTNEECGFLAEGFDRPPALMMPYTQPCYLDFMRELGYRCVRRLLAFEITSGGRVPERMDRFNRRLRERLQVTVRPVDPARFDEEAAQVFGLYNRIWESNWGFVPMTEAEFRYAAAELRPIADPGLVLLAERDGEAVGFALTLPDINAVLRRMRGRVWPFGWFWFLARRRLVRRVRILMLGVLPAFRGRGLDTLLYQETARRCIERGYYDGEASWILEDNAAMRRPMERAGARVSKIYHLYEKPLCASS